MVEGRILVVEDENITALHIQNHLTKLGYAVLGIASSGEQAIHQVSNLRPDLVLMDIKLRGQLDGIEVAEQIRTQFEIPVVYLTAYADEATLQRAKVTEPFGYITKPFAEKDLFATIEMVLYKHRMEQKLRESEQWLATTLKSVGDGLIATDAQGCVKFMNPVAEALTGWTQVEALDRDLGQVFHIIHEGIEAPSENPANRVLRNGSVVDLEDDALLVARDGRQIPIDDSAAPILDDNGNVTGAVVVFRDSTERKRAEEELNKHRSHLEELIEGRTIELKKANQHLEQEIAERRRAEEQIVASLREKEVLLQEIHHRVKNNLQVITSMLDMQSMYTQDPQALRVLRNSQNRIRAMAFVHEKLYHSDDMASVNVTEYVQSVTNYLFDVYGSRAAGIALRVEVDDISLDLDAAIACGLIINELVSNALKYAFTPVGDRPSEADREAEIRVELRSQGDNWFMLEVSDNGVGLPPDTDPGDPQSLGLRLVTIFAKQLRGTIDLDKSAGTGFKITFRYEERGSSKGVE